MKKGSLWVVVLILSCFKGYSQSQEVKDSTVLSQILRGGRFSSKIRTYAMATTNKGHLADNYAWAIGGGIHYESPILWKHLSFEIGGVFITNLASSDLGKPDSATQVKDRYEIALFDLENPNNRSVLDRMDEFNTRFHFFKKSKLTLGRQIITSPLINPQDGRMRPSLMSGLWFTSDDIVKTHIEGGWLWSAAPRSTVRWFSTAESIGVYSNGVNEDGSKGNYFMNLESKGIFAVGVKSKLLPFMQANVWNYFIENIQNTTFAQLDFEYPLSISGKKKDKLKASLQVIHQNTLNDGGNANPQKTYVQNGSKTWILGGRIGLQISESEILMNYTHITSDGRFTFPREWGREPLLTFMQRERNEGSGGVDALNITWTKQKGRLKTFIGAGYYKMPDVKNVRLNKYGMPSYTQLNVSALYRFNGYLKNMTAEALIVHKWNKGRLYDNEKYRINKVDMTNYNLILNYSF